MTPVFVQQTIDALYSNYWNYS